MKSAGGARRGVAAWSFLAAAVLLIVPPSVEGATKNVVVRAGQTARDVAEEHLGSADLWPDLLEQNGLGSASDVTEGRSLQVPDLPVAQARKVLAESLAVVQEATAIGASVFAADALDAAVRQRDDAVRAGRRGDWDAALAGAEEALGLAETARDQARERRDGQGEAVLSAGRGQVQGRRAEALVWTERPLQSTLVENERVRTLSNSFAEVQFADRSQIRLGANAQVLIQRMEVDHLNARRRTRVSLVEGDAFALLGGSGSRDFDMGVEAVDARIDSKNFWVRRDVEGAKFANYDDRPVTLSDGQSEVTLGWNQGTVVSEEHGASEPKDLLPPPKRVGPGEASIHYRDAVLLQWDPVDGAASYSVEVDHDSRFRAPVIAARGVSDARFLANGLGRGRYSWRVRAVDEAGFPGAASGAGRFDIEAEGKDPYLHVSVPATDGPTGARTLVLRGESTPEVALTIDGKAVAVDDDGRFERSYRLRAGDNRIVFEARAPSGRVSRVERQVRHLPSWFAPLEYDAGLPRLGPNHFVTRRRHVTLAGETLPRATIDIVAEDGRVVAAAQSRATGRFHLTVPVEGVTARMRARVTNATGFVTEERFAVTLDARPPVLHLPDSLPTRTRDAELVLQGQVEEGARLEINDAPVAVAGTTFRATVPLREGHNQLFVRASDEAGNLTERRLEVERDVGGPEVEETAWLDTDGSSHAVRVVAEDPAGLRRHGRYGLARGDRIEAGVLRLQPDGRTYLGQVPSQGTGEKLRLVFVELEDRLGNRRRYEF